MKSFTTLTNYAASLSQNTSTANAALFAQMINDAQRYLVQKYFFNEATTTILTVANQTAYALPYDYSKLKTGTVTVGTLKWNPVQVLSEQDWENITNFPLTSDIPNNFFIYNNQFRLWPTPSTSGNTITFNYQRRVTDLTVADYTTGTVSATNGNATVTGAGTAFLTNYLPAAGSVLALNLWIKLAPPGGDGNWYQVSSIASNTSLTLVNPYQGGTTSGATFVVGQMPVLLEDFHDLLAYRALKIYFSSVAPSAEKAKEFGDLYDLGIQSLDSYAGQKAQTVNLRGRVNTINGNLFPSNLG